VDVAKFSANQSDICQLAVIQNISAFLASMLLLQKKICVKKVYSLLGGPIRRCISC